MFRSQVTLDISLGIPKPEVSILKWSKDLDDLEGAAFSETSSSKHIQQRNGRLNMIETYFTSETCLVGGLNPSETY